MQVKPAAAVMAATSEEFLALFDTAGWASVAVLHKGSSCGNSGSTWSNFEPNYSANNY